MPRYDLDRYTLPELKKLAEKLELPHRRSRTEMAKDIETAFDQYIEYKTEKLDKYERVRQLGTKGKEGTTYLVRDRNGKEYAMKTFRDGKSSRTLHKEYTLQKKASKMGISPKVYDVNTTGKWIVMEKMDCHLYEYMEKKDNILSKKHQDRIFEIFRKLDEACVFHNDANFCNYMMKDRKVYMIDYGFAKEITPALKKQLGTDTPNQKLMLIALVSKLKEKNVPERSYKYLYDRISAKDRELYKI